MGFRGALFVLVVACVAACDRPSPSRDPTARRVAVDVPAALRIARGLDTLSVELDPDLRADKTVQVAAKRTVGVAYTARVFERGRRHLVSQRRGYVAGRGFDLGKLVWRTDRDGLPRRDHKYLVEMHLVLFETDVPPSPGWHPRAGHFHALLTRTLRQAEE